jgi:hypothetical protein
MSKRRANVLLPVEGLNTGAPGEWIDLRQVPNVQNMEVNRSALRQRPGTTLLGASMGERVMKITELEQGLSKQTIRIGLSKVQLLNKTTGAWTDIHHTTLTGSALDKFTCAFPVLAGQKILVFTNGHDAVWKWTGTGNTAVLGGTPPKFAFCVFYKGYLMALNITDDGTGTSFGQRVQWHNLADLEDWAGGDAGSSNLLEEGVDITGGAVFGDYIAIHKESCIYLAYLVGTSDVFRFERQNTGVGAVSNDTIFNLPTGGQIFLARDGIHVFNGTTAPLINSPIMDEIRESMSPEYAWKATAQLVASKDEYHVAIPIGSQTEPETVYKYNYRTGKVWKDYRPGLVTLGLYERSTDEAWDDDPDTWDSDLTRWDDVMLEALSKVLIMGFADGTVTRMDGSLADAGAAIDAFFETKDFTAQDLGSDVVGQMVDWLEVRHWALGTGMDASYSVDGGQNWVAIETVTLTADYPPDSLPGITYLSVVSSKIRFKFRNSEVAGTFQLKQFVPAGMLAEEGV